MKCMRVFEGGTKCSYPGCGWFVSGKPKDLRHLAPGTKLQDGRYIVGVALGSGGFGIVYIALDTTSNMRLAIKEFYPVDLATRALGTKRLQPVNVEAHEHMRDGVRFLLHEGQMLADLARDKSASHGVVRVLDAFEENDTAYLIMELLEGDTFVQYIKRKPGGKISWELALSVLEPVFASLEAVHRKGIVHLDVAADNIILTSDSYVKLLDFGAAKRLAADATQSLPLSCKEGYSPPEQYVSGGNTGPWTDVYASAATLYLAVTGKLPPAAPDRYNGTQLPLPRQLGAMVPQKGQRALLRALSLRQADRFRNIADFWVALNKKHSWWHRPRRAGIVIAVSGSVMVALLTIFTGLRWGLSLSPHFFKTRTFWNMSPTPGMYVTQQVRKSAPLTRHNTRQFGSPPSSDIPENIESPPSCAMKDLTPGDLLIGTDLGPCGKVGGNGTSRSDNKIP
jgi:serine/threonine protein kinase